MNSIGSYSIISNNRNRRLQNKQKKMGALTKQWLPNRTFNIQRYTSGVCIALVYHDYNRVCRKLQDNVHYS